MKWSESGKVDYWVTMDQEFLKGLRYNDENTKLVASCALHINHY